MVVRFSLRLSQSRALYDGATQLYARRQENKLDAAQIRVLELYLNEAKLAGVALNGDAKKRFNEIKVRDHLSDAVPFDLCSWCSVYRVVAQEELSALSTTFMNNVMDATASFSLVVTNSEDVQGIA